MTKQPENYSKITLLIFLAPLIGLAIFSVYYPSVNNSFHLDDFHIINHVSEDSDSLLKRGRAIVYMTFAWNYKTFGLKTSGYHWMNMNLHIANVFLF